MVVDLARNQDLMEVQACMVIADQLRKQTVRVLRPLIFGTHDSDTSSDVPILDLGTNCIGQWT